jgi:predicted acetyltransferase
MNVQLIKATESRLILNLFPYYNYDMTQLMGWQPTTDGTYAFSDALNDVNDYWLKDDHFPYLIYVNKQLAGFCLVRVSPYEQPRFDMGQFFVLKKYKGQGVGKKAFELAVNKHPGHWLVRILPENSAAQKFWPRAIHAVKATCFEQSVEQYRSIQMNFLRFETPS